MKLQILCKKESIMNYTQFKLMYTEIMLQCTYPELPKCRRNISALIGNDSPAQDENSDNLRMSTLQDSLFFFMALSIFLDIWIPGKKLREVQTLHRVHWTQPTLPTHFCFPSSPIVLKDQTPHVCELHDPPLLHQLREWIQFLLLWNSHTLYSSLKMSAASQFKYTAFPSVVDILYFRCPMQWSSHVC